MARTDYCFLLAGGALLGLMTGLNGILAQYLSIFEVSCVVHAIGAVLLLGYLKVRMRGKLRLAGAPWYVYLVGFFGVGMVSSSSFCASRVGAALTLAVSVAGQLAASAVADHFGLFGVPVVRWNWRRLGPYALILGGLGLMLW